MSIFPLLKNYLISLAYWKLTTMLKNNSTPGVYIEEKSAFPNPVISVETAIPAFIGYTPKINPSNGADLFKPIEVTSMAVFMHYFGYPADPKSGEYPSQYTPVWHLTQLKKKPKKGNFYPFNGNVYAIEPDPATIYYLYNSLLLFFQNGGQKAYIVSVGTYGPPSGAPIQPGDPLVNPNVKLAALQQGLNALMQEQVVTLYVLPEATLLSAPENGALMEAALQQCGVVQTAMVLLDVIGGRTPDPELWEQDIQSFRDNTGSNALSFGAAYYPFLETTAVLFDQVTYANIGNTDALLPLLDTPEAPNPQAISILKAIADGKGGTIEQNNAALVQASTTYQQILTIIQTQMNILPPSGIMAGIYALTDAQAGVWKAPANVSPIGVTDLTLRLTSNQQENLNVDAMSGKSINAFRYFAGQGILVWGARTLDGNSQDWRYINVRRTITMIEQSAKLGIAAYVFQPNDATTWAAVKSMLENFLNNIWQEGGLQGGSPQDAYSVQVGLGITMTGQDIKDGFLRVTILIAVVHPAEFIVITLEQLQASS